MTDFLAQYEDVITIEHGFDSNVILRIFDKERRDSLHCYLSYETTHALADWITANVPKPEPKTAWDHWLDFEVGQVFTIGGSGNRYRKITATEAVYLGDKETYKIDPDMKIAWSPMKYDFLSEVVLPFPTKFAAVVKADGRRFVRTDHTMYPWTDAAGTYSDQEISNMGFEVIYEGVDE